MSPPSSSEPEPYAYPDATVLEDWAYLRSECLLVEEDIYPGIARRLLRQGVTRLLELGSDVGPIATELVPHGVEAVLVDLAPEPLARAAATAVRADLHHLPVRPQAFDGVAATNCLYFFADPTVPLREGYAALAPGGTFVASAPNRFHDPELAEVEHEWGKPSPFDGEDAGEVVARVFGDVEVERWEMVAFRLADTEAVGRYLRAFGNPDPFERAACVATPVEVTKSGAHVRAKKPR